MFRASNCAAPLGRWLACAPANGGIYVGVEWCVVMRNEESGPMGKASFEETMDNFLKAGVYGQEEATRGVSASIICGKLAQIGTGVCELTMDVKSLPYNVPIMDEKVEEKYYSSRKKTSPIDDVVQQMTYLEC